MSENTCCQLMLHKSNLWSEYLSGNLSLASFESRRDGLVLPAYASERRSGYGENHRREVGGLDSRETKEVITERYMLAMVISNLDLTDHDRGSIDGADSQTPGNDHQDHGW